METNVSFYHKVNLYENDFSQVISCCNLTDIGGGGVGWECY